MLASLTCFGSFVAANWKNGWIGRYMNGVFFDYLQLQEDDIIALTTLNFTGSTDPNNATSVYLGASAWTRCCWELHLGHLVKLCQSQQSKDVSEINRYDNFLTIDGSEGYFEYSAGFVPSH